RASTGRDRGTDSSVDRTQTHSPARRAAGDAVIGFVMKRSAAKTRKTNRRVAPRKKMPKFFAVDEEMKHRAALLEGELVTWPGVKTKPMFGMISFFRKGAIFAAVPRTKTLRSATSIILKFDPVPDSLGEKIKVEPRIAEGAPGPGAGWHAFEVASHEDIKEALWWLNQAYELAK